MQTPILNVGLTPLTNIIKKCLCVIHDSGVEGVTSVSDLSDLTIDCVDCQHHVHV